MNRNDHHLIQQVLDGNVSPEAFDGFQQRLREEPELLQLYGEYALLQHTLCEEFEGGGAPGLRLLEPAPRSFGILAAVADEDFPHASSATILREARRSL